ncbi:MAG: DNA-processing protein DprA [Candidatus Poribacteria bacterium]|nr:DNA-processing protein DprA [Candidatus Poribacteria bacterium]
MSGREFWFALASVDGVGPMRIKRLINRFGTIEAVFDAELSEIARVPLFNPLLATRVLKARIRIAEFRRHIKWFKSRGVEILCVEDRDYPEQLKKIPNAPAILCKKGRLSQVSQQAVAIVGTKTPTELGILTTLELSAGLIGAGFSIVSGLAKGVDTAAHLGALSVDGTTVGVLGCDLFSIYPSENRELADRICENGALFSEHPFTTQSTPVNLVLRNRIISGLSMATIVVESGENGGAIRTARFAFEQDRLVLACDWGKRHPLSEGPHRLIQQGAYPISPDRLADAVDILLNPGSLKKVQPTHLTGEQMNLF